MKVGIILHRFHDANCKPNINTFIVDVGWGQVRYFVSKVQYNIGDYVLYDDFFSEDLNNLDKFYVTREDWIKSTASKEDNSKRNRIDVICRLDECDFLGNIKYDTYRPTSSKADIVIARKDLFVYWEGYGDGSYYGMKTFDKISNSLLFLILVTPRYGLPDEKDFMRAYTDARKKVEELDIPNMIEELKVELFTSCFTRRGSDNVLLTSKKVEYNYSYHYSYLNDDYLESLFPQYSEDLYHSKDHDCDFIHPKFENSKVIKNTDGSIDLVKAKYEGVDIDVFCANKTKELRQVALKNFERYNKDEHINSIAYRHLYWSKIYNYNEDNNFIMKMKGLAELIWGFKHEKLLEQINNDNYQELIEYNNSIHPTPQFPEDSDVIWELRLLDKS